jgi:hypothetical protein
MIASQALVDRSTLVTTAPAEVQDVPGWTWWSGPTAPSPSAAGLL